MPGPLGTDSNSPVIDKGTLALTKSPLPGLIDSVPLRAQERIAEAIRRSLPMLPAEARHQVQAMLSPESLTIIAGTLLLWAGSHFFGVGEIVDIILLAVGFAVLGLAVFSEAKRVNVDFSAWMVQSLYREARKLGVTRQSLIKMWLADKLVHQSTP